MSCEHLEIILLGKYEAGKEYCLPQNQELKNNFYLGHCLSCESTLLRNFDQYKRTHWVTERKEKPYDGIYDVYHHVSIFNPKVDGDLEGEKDGNQ